MKKPPLPKTRAEAFALIVPRYFTGKPCKHGHLVERITESGACTKCLYLLQTEARKKFRALLKAKEASKKGK